MNCEKEIKELENAIRRVKRTISGVNGNERCVIKKYKGKSYLYRSSGNKPKGNRSQHYLSLKSPEAGKLLNERFCRELLPVLEKELKCLKLFRRDYDPDRKYELINEYPEDMQAFIRRIVRSPREIAEEWAAQPYEHNPFPFDPNSSYNTKKGETVRSRIELIVADLLYDMGIPYRYECVYHAHGRKYYPDFTIMHPATGELYYLELFGMMDSHDYVDRTIEKITAYQRTDDADHFIFLYDSATSKLNNKVIHDILKKYFSSPQ